MSMFKEVLASSACKNVWVMKMSATNFTMASLLIGSQMELPIELYLKTFIVAPTL